MLNFLVMLLLVIVAPQLTANEQISEKEKRPEEWAADQIIEMSEEDYNRVMAALNVAFSLDWKEAGTYSLPESHSTLTLPEGYSIVVGEDAKKLNALNRIVVEEALEAIVVQHDKNQICFCNVQNGYIPLENWSEINPDEQLAYFKEGFDKSDHAQLEGWALEPYLDVENHVLYYALKIKLFDLQIVRTHALKLSSNGYEEIVCLSYDPSYSPLEEFIELISKGYSFDPGYRYEDYTPSDNAED